MKKLIAFICLVIVLMSAYTIDVDAAPARAWGWFDKPSSNQFTLSSYYQFNSTGGAIVGKRSATGVYQVVIPNMGSHYNGVCHAVAYGGNHSVQVVNWGRSGSNLNINLKAFAPTGRPIDGRFVIFFYHEDKKSGAYTWMSSPGEVTHGYTYNSSGGRNTVTKTGTGRYKVEFAGLKPDVYTQQKGNVLVTPYNGTARRAQVINWGLSSRGGASVNVQITDANGQPADSKFVISFINDFNIGQNGNGEDADCGAFVWANDATASRIYSPSATYAKNNASKNIKIQRLSTGSYKVQLGLVPHQSSTMAIATSYGSNNTYASVDKWLKSSSDSGTDVYVKCYDANGNLADSKFTLFYYSNKNILY